MQKTRSKEVSQNGRVRSKPKFIKGASATVFFDNQSTQSVDAAVNDTLI
jgi:hypothetical protein